MKNDNNISIFKYDEIEIIDDEIFLQKLKNDKRLKKYIELNKMKNNEIQRIIKNERVENYTENKFNYMKLLKVINGTGQFEDKNIMTGQVFTINYKNDTLTIVDKKIYEGHFEKTNKYSYYLKDVGIAEDEIKVILNNISRLKQKNNQKNDCKFLLYVLANRKLMPKKEKKNIEIESEIDNLFKLWNITDKYYSYKQYRIYLNLYEELYIDYLKKNSAIDLLCYEKIKEEMKKIKKEIMKGD